MDDAVAELRFLTQSENRSAVLDLLSRAGPLDRRELETRLDASHRTVIRILNSLEERGYLRETDDGVRLTPFGGRMATELDDAVSSVDVALEFAPLLRHAPPTLDDLPLRSLRGAELRVASDADPFSILDRILSLRAEATRIREVAPGVQKESIDQLAGRLRRGEDVDVEVVLSRHASDLASSRTDYRDGHTTAVDSDAVDVYVHPDRITFFAGVLDDTAAVAVSRDGQPHALAVSDDPDLRAAVESVFETYREASTPKASI